MMVIDLMWETMVLNVITGTAGAIVKLNIIVKIHKYRGLHEGHHFISMAMEVHDTPRHDMDHFIKKCVHLFHDRQLKNHLSLSFCIQFFKQRVNITFQCALASTVEKKIVLTCDACFKHPITIRSHNLHASGHG
jgi:hypothetical protein